MTFTPIARSLTMKFPAQSSTTTSKIHRMIKGGEDINEITILIDASNLPKHLSSSLRYLASKRQIKTITAIEDASDIETPAQQTDPKDRMLIGRSLLAPILYTFYKRLIARLAITQETSDNPLNIFFLAREGYLLKRGFDRIMTESKLPNRAFHSHYLMASRVMLSKAAFHIKESHEYIVRHQYKGSFSSFFSGRLGIEQNTLKAIALKHPFMNEAYSLTGSSKAFEIVASEFDFSEESQNYLDYLDGIGFTRSPTRIVVDLGYSGTIQDLLSLIAPGKIEGYYLITTPSAINSLDKTTPNIKHGLVASGVSWGSCSLLDKSILLETLLTSPDGSCLGVNRIENEFIFRYGTKCSTQYRFEEVQDIFDKAMDHVMHMFEQGLEELDYTSLSPLYSGIVSSHYFSMPNNAIKPLLEIEDNYGGNMLLDVNKIISQ